MRYLYIQISLKFVYLHFNLNINGKMEEDFKSRAFQLLGNIIRKKRIEQNITQDTLGEKVGYGELTRRQAISQIERGNVSIPNKKLNLFIDALKLDNTFITQVNYLLSRGEYEEATHLLEEREEQELKIAIEISHHVPTSDEATITNLQGEQDPEIRESPHPDEADGIENSHETDLTAINIAEIKLAKLKVLFEKELITEEEFDLKRKEVLDKYF